MARIQSLCVLGVCALVACSNEIDDEDNEYEITEQALQGVIGGTAWSFVTGETNSFLSDEEDFFTSLFSAANEACGFDDPGAPMVLASLPTTPGTYSMGLSQNLTFVPTPGENLIATQGVIRVDTVTETTVSAGIYATYDGDNEVDGTFEVTICTD